MISAFGVDHGEISKSLKPRHLEALKRAKEAGAWYEPGFGKASYAKDRLKLHALKDTPGEYKGPLPLSAGYHKKFMAQATRTRRNIRDKNRKPIFRDEVKS